jgi:hypothetical protein
MTAQLDLTRPALEGSIRAILSKYTLWVLAYGGWEDAFTRQLVTTIREQGAAQLDVLWCYYGSADSLAAEATDDHVLGRLKGAPGNIQFYVDFDVNTCLPNLERELSAFLHYPTITRSSSSRGPVLGWVPISRTLSAASTTKADDDSALTFFDGRLPNWSDARSSHIPRRDMTGTLLRELRARLDRRVNSLFLLTGAAGEGKTTIAMQVAWGLAVERSGIDVYFNSDNRWTVESVLSLPSDRIHVYVVDDAFRSIERMRELVQRLNESDRRHIHVLAVSRDTDWASVGGNTFVWSKYVETRRHHLRGVNQIDARAIIQAWEEIGPAALGELAKLSTTAERIAALMDAATDLQRSQDEGAFLGALLKTKYGPGLADHVRELLIRLSEREVYAAGRHESFRLLDSFFMIAVPHASGLPSLPSEVLAEIHGLSPAETLAQIVIPLGDEAAISFNGEGVTTRHSSIAAAACELAPDVGIDLERVVRSVVSSAVRLVSAKGMRPALRPVAYLAQQLLDPTLAVVAARTAVETEPRRVSYRTSLSRAYRRANEFSKAVELGQATLEMLTSFDDLESGIRPMFSEWGVAEGNHGNWARNAVLCAVALQDLDLLGPVTRRQTVPTLACLALALRRLWERHRSYLLLQGLAALDKLASGLVIDDKQDKWLSDAATLAFRNGAPTFDQAQPAIRALTEACRFAASQLEAPLPSSMPPLRFRFDGLMSLQ